MSSVEHVHETKYDRYRQNHEFDQSPQWLSYIENILFFPQFDWFQFDILGHPLISPPADKGRIHRDVPPSAPKEGEQHNDRVHYVRDPDIGIHVLAQNDRAHPLIVQSVKFPVFVHHFEQQEPVEHRHHDPVQHRLDAHSRVRSGSLQFAVIDRVSIRFVQISDVEHLDIVFVGNLSRQRRERDVVIGGIDAHRHRETEVVFLRRRRLHINVELLFDVTHYHSVVGLAPIMMNTKAVVSFVHDVVYPIGQMVVVVVPLRIGIPIDITQSVQCYAVLSS